MFLYDLRRGRKWGLLAIAAFIVFCTVCISVVAAWHHFLNPNRDMLNAGGMPATPLELYVPATYETFGCLAAGPSDCDRFDDYVSSVSASPVAFTYSPLREDDPGNPNADGTHTITLDSTLTPEQWQALGTAVTQNQTLQGTQINPEEVALDGSVATVEVPSSAADGEPSTARIEFEFTGSAEDPSTVRVIGVTYDEQEAG